MIEVEIKLPLGGKRNQVLKKLQEEGFRARHRIRETDVYFDRNREVRRSGSALRIREIRDLQMEQSRFFLTYKGAKIDTVSMTRQEQETEIADAAIGKKILEALGYQAVPPVVIKTREELTVREQSDCMDPVRWSGMTACLDHVEGLGDFLELEILVPEDTSAEQEALEKIRCLLGRLGYSMQNTVTDSYLSMLQGERD